MSTLSAPDLTQRPPRSPHVRLGGYVMLPRLLDKARASAAGTLGDYRYTGKGMDRHFLNFVGIDADALKAEAAAGKGDGDLLNWINEQARTPRTPWEIKAWSDYFTLRAPDSDAETLADFAAAVAEHSKTREDVLTWFNLLDLDDHCSFGGKA